MRVLKIQSAVEFGLGRKTKSDAFWSLNFMHSRILRIADLDWHIDRFAQILIKNRHILNWVLNSLKIIVLSDRGNKTFLFYHIYILHLNNIFKLIYLLYTYKYLIFDFNIFNHFQMVFYGFLYKFNFYFYFYNKKYLF